MKGSYNKVLEEQKDLIKQSIRKVDVINMHLSTISNGLAPYNNTGMVEAEAIHLRSILKELEETFYKGDE